MERGQQTKKQRNKERNKHTSRLLDQLGPEGQVGEKVNPYTFEVKKKYTNSYKTNHASGRSAQ